MSESNHHIETLLKELKANNIHLALENGMLKLKYNGSKPSETLINDIKIHKQAIIDFLQTKRRNTIVKTAVSENGYPVSSSQFRLWLISQIQAYSATYNMPFQILLKQEINALLLEKAILKVIKRHESLRTVFRKNDQGEVMQWINSPKDFNFTLAYTDLSQNQENSKEIANEMIQKDQYVPFDLENGPLVRCALYKLKEAVYLFYFNMHHIISDGWSIQIFSKEIMQYYTALSANKPFELPALEIQYKDYTQWQKQQLLTDKHQQDKFFWESIFEETVTVLDLFVNTKRPTKKTNAGYLLRTYFSETESKQINTFVSQTGGTLFMFLAASVKILCYLYSGNQDIVVGTPVAGREHKLLEDQIGFYVNTLALRTKMNVTASFHDLYEQIKNHILQVYEHQTYPFEKLVDDLNIHTDPSRNPLFDVFIILQNFSNAKQEETFEVTNPNEIQSIGTVASKFDLTFSFVEIGNIISIDVNYNTAIYRDEDMQMLLRNYKNLVAQLIQFPEKKVNEFSLLPETNIATTHKKDYENFLEKINDEMTDDF